MIVARHIKIATTPVRKTSVRSGIQCSIAALSKIVLIHVTIHVEVEDAMRRWVTGISDPINVCIFLISIWDGQTIIAKIANMIAITIRLIGIGRSDAIVAVVRNTIAVQVSMIIVTGAKIAFIGDLISVCIRMIGIRQRMGATVKSWEDLKLTDTCDGSTTAVPKCLRPPLKVVAALGCPMRLLMAPRPRA